MTTTVLAALSRAEARAQSLATGTIGGAIVAIERALNGTGDWATANTIVKRVVSGPIDAVVHTGLYYGAPAVLFMLQLGTVDCRDRYASARQTLDKQVRRVVRERLAASDARIRCGRAATFAEYDLFYGLVGLGALLLQSSPGSDELSDLLTYVVRLTESRTVDGERVPGWWVDHDPDPGMPTPGGHANLGMAHGAAGLLSLLALASRCGRQVNAQRDAIERLYVWFDRWRQEDHHGVWWPQWITRDQLRTGQPREAGPGRPSWCYGTAGIARALQLAAIALDQPGRQDSAEAALATCLRGHQPDRLAEPGICHGLAGLYQTAYRAAADARSPDIAALLAPLGESLILRELDPHDSGFLTGRTGLALAMETVRRGTPPQSRWDTCLLIA